MITSKPLGEVGVSVHDCEHKTPAAQNSGHPYIAIPDIVDGRIDISTTRKISDEDLQIWTRRTTPQVGDIVVTRRGRVGDTAPIPQENCAIGQNLVILRSDETQVLQEYLRWATRSPSWYDEVDRYLNVGAVFSSLNVRDIPKLSIPVPSLSIQRAIAEVLGALDDKIAANNTVMEAELKLASALASTVDQFCLLSDLASIQRRSTNPAELGDESIAHFSLPAFDDGSVSVEAARDIKSAKNQLLNPSVLVSKLNPRIPRIWPIPKLPSQPALASTEFVCLEPKDISIGALWAALTQPSFSSQLEALAGGTTGSHQRVKPDAMLSASVIDLRAADKATLGALDSLCIHRSQLVHENRVLARTRDELLPLLMNGTITVREAEDRTKEVL